MLLPLPGSLDTTPIPTSQADPPVSSTAQQQTSPTSSAAASTAAASATPTALPTESPTPSATVPTREAATQTPTATPTAATTLIPPIRFAVIGDYGLAGQPARDVADLIAGWGVDFILTVGDNNYPLGEAETIDENIGQYYHSYIYPYQGSFGDGADTNRFYPTLGNHDYETKSAQPYLDYFELPGNERYYDFIWGPVHFFAINSDSREPDGVGRSSIQANWLREGLASSSSPWKVVYGHHPPFSSGTHGGIGWMDWPFKEWGADVYLAGHDHTYERLLVDGFPYIINGLGGGARYGFPNLLPESQVRYQADYGAMLVTASSDWIQFEFYTRQGVQIDSYTILAEEAQPASSYRP
jgi:tartrate-resistant acid phosphatase type 5